MRESIANSYIFTIIMIFVGIIIVILVGSLSYSKTFKIKNKVVDIIEKNKGYNNSRVRDEIEDFLKTTGYKTNPYDSNNRCPAKNGAKAINTLKNYYFCVYRFDTVKGPYYSVTVFMHFDIPVIESILQFPLSGETRVLYEL